MRPRVLAFLALAACNDSDVGTDELFRIDQNSVTSTGSVVIFGIEQCSPWRGYEKIQITTNPECARGLPSCCREARRANWMCAVLDPDYSTGYHSTAKGLWVHEDPDANADHMIERWQIRFVTDDALTYSDQLGPSDVGAPSCETTFIARKDDAVEP